MTRGKKKLNDRQAILVRQIRESRVRLDAVDLEIAQRIAEITASLKTEAEAEVRSRVWAALDSGVPRSEIKVALKISNHQTFLDRYVRSYVESAPVLFEGKWFSLRAADDWTMIRLENPEGTELYVRATDSLNEPRYRDDSKALIASDHDLVAWVDSKDKGDELLNAIYKYATKGPLE